MLVIADIRVSDNWEKSGVITIFLVFSFRQFPVFAKGGGITNCFRFLFPKKVPKYAKGLSRAFLRFFGQLKGMVLFVSSRPSI